MAVQKYSTIVVGCGGAGSAALYHLARRGESVLGIEQFEIGHDRGSSHGETRVIRMAYFEHPDYVPLLQQSYSLWRELERQTGRHLFHETGLIEVGPADGIVVPGVLDSAQQYGLPVERWSRKDLQDRAPMLRLPAGLEIVFEKRAGYLLVEESVRAHVHAARQFGAEIAAPCAVQQIEQRADGLRVVTEYGSFESERLVICGGAWARTLMGQTSVSLPLTILRKVLHWFPVRDERYRADHGFPVFFYEHDGKFIYGFPSIDGSELKVAQHSGGVAVENPDRLDRADDVSEREVVEAFVRTYMPGLGGHATRQDICMYTMTPDEHFIVDRHPDDPRIAYVCGLSGHGFKFTPVLGQMVSQLVLDGQTDSPAEFLRRRW